MAEYIDREAALDLIDRYWQQAYNAYFLDAAVRLGSVYREMEDFPAADVRPVVRGHIEEDENTYLFCSECNCNITLAAYETPDNRLVLRPNFCPNCGADMREES